MFKILKKNKGQGLAVQYSVTFFLIVGVVSAMTVYIKRALQARIKDARQYMFLTANEAFLDQDANLQGTLLWKYEPYYANKTTTRVVDRDQKESTFGSLPTAGSGIYLDETTETTRTKDKSKQKSPREAQ